ncbi:MAG: hypothetical protein J0L84_03400 [Verrucomicrobia bacterium]|nr:hypothetical protein [Verrucomicrobiota bacterium]
MKNRPAVTAVAGLVLMGSLAALAWTWAGPPAPGPGSIQDAIGEALGRQALKHLGSGGRCIVLTRDTAIYPQPAADRVLGALTRTVRAGGGSVPEVQTFEVDPLRPAQVPPGDFLEQIRRAKSGDVVVSLMGPPLLSDEQRAQLPPSPACRVVALCAGPFPDAAAVRSLARQQVLHAAVMDRPDGGAALPPARRGREAFEDRYVVFEATAEGSAR